MSREKFSMLSLKPRSHFRILINRTWAKRGGRYIIGRREKWPEKVGRREKSGRKCRDEGEN